MKIGSFLLNFTNIQRIHQLKTFEEAVNHPALQGIACVDGDTQVYDKYDIREMKRVLDDHGIETSSIYHVAHCDEFAGQGRQKVLDDLKRQLDRCAFMETKMFMPIPECRNDMERSERQKIVLDYFNTAAEAVVPYGMQVIMENISMVQYTFATVSDIGFYLDQIPELGYALDTGNFWFNDSDVLEACDKFMSRIVHVHLKDILPYAENPPRVFLGRGLDVVATGDGIIPIPVILERLKQNGYEGALSLEITTPVQLTEKVARSVSYLKNWLD